MAPPASFRRPSLRSAPQGRKGVRVIAPERVADPSSWRAAARGLGGLLLAAPLALFTAVLLAEGAQEAQATAPTAQAEGQLVEGRFGPCIGGERHTCVVDGVVVVEVGIAAPAVAIVALDEDGVDALALDVLEFPAFRR